MMSAMDRANPGQYGFALVWWPSEEKDYKYETVLLVWRWTFSLFFGKP